MKNNHTIFFKFHFCVLLSVFLITFCNLNTFAIITESTNPSQNSSPNSAANSNEASSNSVNSSTSSGTNSSNVSSSTSKVNIPSRHSSRSRVAVSPPSSKAQPNSNSSTSNNTSASKSEKSAPAANPTTSAPANNSKSTPSQDNKSRENVENKPEVAVHTNSDSSSSNNVVSKQTTSETKPDDADKNKEEKSKAPEDLPKVESSEIDFPEVVAPSSTEKTESINYLAGIIAWLCILLGAAIVIFVMVKGKSNADVPIQKISGHKKRRKKGRHLLPDDFYRDKF